jgi:hypothetical protein
MKNKIEKILENKYGYLTEDHPFQAKAIEELFNLIQKEREEAVRGFADWQNRGYFNASPITQSDVTFYLSQTKGGKE